ncbi:hypothetical protein DUNSADRAFT_7563 [Dunaliella salina]|uniref:Core domain-containing protein n=1 Tax=Dunaliella salina TaxID=3046 RepID=A0ABQ7GL49_DUNSA|nr:hypothetical protein DUNSADRAFT_7563 [Dunaliella salina]|eukprot:KAF5835331.1 hypothetical protein DUNSADRAFT_7563 [Dunaliella salina]
MLASNHPCLQLSTRPATSTLLPRIPRRCSRPSSSKVSVRVQSPEAPQQQAPLPPPVSLTEAALKHLKKLKNENQNSGNLLLRVGVKQGGCSGMSYLMDFEERGKITADDMVVDYDDGNFSLVIDPKSLLYLFGMKLDYSDALIGGGFQFSNPNAQDSCGCGKSFGV